jgi:hypothetical protein
MNFENINNFDEFKAKCDSLKGRESGVYFELLTKYIFLLHEQFKENVENCWMYKELPYDIKLKLKLPDADKGVDLVTKYKNDKYAIVQSKYRSNEKKQVAFGELATFFAQILCQKGETDSILMTNTNIITWEVDHCGIKSHNNELFRELNINFFEKIRNYEKSLEKNVDIITTVHSFDRNLEMAYDYIKKFEKIPNKRKETNDIDLGRWIYDQIKYYKNGKLATEKIEKWETFYDFMSKYKKHNGTWENNLQKLEEFIINNNRKPNYNSESDEEKKIYTWISTQYVEHKKQKMNIKYINIWERFLETYSCILLNRERKEPKKKIIKTVENKINFSKEITNYKEPIKTSSEERKCLNKEIIGHYKKIIDKYEEKNREPENNLWFENIDDTENIIDNYNNFLTSYIDNNTDGINSVGCVTEEIFM